MTKSENIIVFPDLKVIEEEAAAWVAGMDSRANSADKNSLLHVHYQARFQKWIEQSPQHREAIERMAAIWGGCDILDELNYIEHEVESADEASKTKQKFVRVVGAIAASLLVVFAAIFYQTSGYFDQTQTSHFITTVGSQKTISLVDGSTVILNTDSEIKVAITSNIRTIRLVRGEVHFEVASDRSRPFRVLAGGGVVKAVGTAFTVFLHEKSVEVTVTEGVVELLAQPENFSEIKLMVSDNTVKQELRTVAALTAGQNAVFTEKIESLEQMSEEELDRKLLWREGFIAFAGEPLSMVVADISRYTDIIIEIDDPDLEDTPIGGHFKVGDVEGMFEALENIFGVQVDHISASHVKLSRPL